LNCFAGSDQHWMHIIHCWRILRKAIPANIGMKRRTACKNGPVQIKWLV
jgi:hypothetical protein